MFPGKARKKGDKTKLTKGLNWSISKTSLFENYTYFKTVSIFATQLKMHETGKQSNIAEVSRQVCCYSGQNKVRLLFPSSYRRFFNAIKKSVQPKLYLYLKLLIPTKTGFRYKRGWKCTKKYYRFYWS